MSGFSRIRVLHVAPQPPPLGGMVTYIQELLKSEVSKAVDVRVVRFDFLGKEKFSGGVRVMVNFLNAIMLTIVFLQETIFWRPHIVHIQTNSGFGFFEKSWIALLAKLMNRRTLLHVHGGNFREFYKQSPVIIQSVIRTCAQLNDRVITASPQMSATWRFIGLSEAKIIHIGNAVHLPVLENERQSHNELTILFLTRIVFAKGIIELIDAVQALCKSSKNIRLRIVGVEELETPKIKEYLAKSSAAKYIHYIGPVSETQKHKEYLNADIFAFPTHVEDQSYAVMEAMSYGLPCVASNVGGVPSLIKDGQNGLLIPPKDSRSLALALDKLERDAALRKQLGDAARKTIENEFCWAHRAKEIIALYRNVVNE